MTPKLAAASLPKEPGGTSGAFLPPEYLREGNRKGNRAAPPLLAEGSIAWCVLFPLAHTAR